MVLQILLKRVSICVEDLTRQVIGMKRWLWTFLLFYLLTLPLRMEKYALLVGINDYQNNINPLRFYVSDIKVLQEMLIDP
jgi:hypothetical protein